MRVQTASKAGVHAPLKLPTVLEQRSRLDAVDGDVAGVPDLVIGIERLPANRRSVATVEVNAAPAKVALHVCEDP
jgi:hypothetical protein